MELIAIDSSFKERFIFKNGNADVAVGSNENNFQLDFDLNIFEKMKSIEFISVDKSEFGGKVTSYIIDTANKKASAKGNTWRGMLNEKIIIPPNNSDYYILSGEPYLIIEELLRHTNMNELFSVKPFNAPSVSNFKFNRYCTLLEGINALFKQINYVLILMYENGRVYVSGLKNSLNEELDNYDCDFVIQKSTCPVNHLICLGKGDLKDRQVIDLYLQEDWTIGDNQYYIGVNERTAVYDYPNVESIEELKNKGIERLKELAAEDENIEMTLNNTDKEIGQSITVYEHFTGQSLTRQISKKVLNISKNSNSIQYEVRD